MSDWQSSLVEASHLIKESQNFLLTCHINPDGDALGSTMGMAHALKSIGKNVTATFSDPFVIPESLQKTLPEVNEVVVPFSKVSGDFDVVMTFDCGSQTRLGDVTGIFEKVDHIINVDHHISNEAFGTVNIIDANAASSGSVVLALLDELKIPLNKNISQCLYVALLTDTGRFQFSSTTPDVFEQAKRHAAFDLPIAQLSRTLTEEDPYAFLKLAGEALSKMEFDADSGLVSALGTIEMRNKYGVEYDEMEGLVEFVRRAKESDVACVIKEFQPGDYRGSLRSLGEIDVCEIASSYGGGGHRFAAGFSTTDEPNKVIENVKALIIAQRNAK